MSHRSEAFVRVLIAVFGVASAFFAPPWVPAVCIVLLALRFSAWEAVLIGAFVDMLWLPTASPVILPPLYTLGAILAVWLLEPVRHRFLE